MYVVKCTKHEFPSSSRKTPPPHDNSSNDADPAIKSLSELTWPIIQFKSQKMLVFFIVYCCFPNLIIAFPPTEHIIRMEKGSKRQIYIRTITSTWLLNRIIKTSKFIILNTNKTFTKAYTHFHFTMFSEVDKNPEKSSSRKQIAFILLLQCSKTCE